MYGYIYLTENLVNGKKYIGQHRHETFDIKYYGSGVLLQKAIEKYGKDNFKVTVLCECFSEEELNEQERKLIKEHNAVKSTEYYNVADGGSNANNLAGKSTEEINEIVTRWRTSMNNRSDEAKQKTYEQWLTSFNNVSEEELKIRKQRYSEAVRKVQSERTIEQEQERIKKILKTRENKSAEQKAITSQKHTAANNKRWKEMTPEKLAERTRKYKETRAKRTEAEKQLTAQKIRDGLSERRKNTSPEEIAKRYEKRQQTFANKTQEELSEISRKISESSKGTVWINNGQNQRRVKQSELDYYQKQGYILGKVKRL